MRRLFGAWEAVQKRPIHFGCCNGRLRDPVAREDKVQRNPIGARSLEGLGAPGRFGLEGLLLFMYPNFIL